MQIKRKSPEQVAKEREELDNRLTEMDKEPYDFCVDFCESVNCFGCIECDCADPYCIDARTRKKEAMK